MGREDVENRPVSDFQVGIIFFQMLKSAVHFDLGQETKISWIWVFYS